MIRSGESFFECAGAVGFEACAGELGERLGVEEAIAGAVDRNIAVAGMDVVEDGLFGLRIDALDVGVNKQAGVAGEASGSDVLEAGRIGEIDAAPCEGG